MITEPESLQSVFDRTFAGISQGLGAFTTQFTPREVGTVISVATGIAKVSGLPGVGFEELVRFPGDELGIAFNLARTKSVSCCLARIKTCTQAMKWNVPGE